MRQVTPLNDRELDIIEDILGPKKLWMLNKIWEERRTLLQHKRSSQGKVKFCRENDRVELLYWENKIIEMGKVEEYMNETLRDLILSLEKKVEPEFFERILKISDPWNKVKAESEEEELLY